MCTTAINCPLLAPYLAWQLFLSPSKSASMWNRLHAWQKRCSVPCMNTAGAFWWTVQIRYLRQHAKCGEAGGAGVIKNGFATRNSTQQLVVSRHSATKGQVSLPYASFVDGLTTSVTHRLWKSFVVLPWHPSTWQQCELDCPSAG